MQDIKAFFYSLIPQSYIQNIEWFFVALLKALLILIIGYYISLFIRSRINKIIAKRDKILAHFLSQVAFILSIVVIIIAALGTIGVQTNSIIAVLGTAGVAIALGLKDSLSSVASGIILILLRPFKQGDLIEANGLSGNVESINLFTTNIRLLDGKFAIVPNSTMAKANIINTVHNDQRRIEFIIGVGYESKIDDVKKTILEALKSCPEVDEKQGYFVGLTELGDSAMNFTIRFWVGIEYGIINTHSKVLESIKEHLDKNNIEIPYNRLDVALKSQ